jgi:hypothetical protein
LSATPVIVRLDEREIARLYILCARAYVHRFTVQINPFDTSSRGRKNAVELYGP